MCCTIGLSIQEIFSIFTKTKWTASVGDSQHYIDKESVIDEGALITPRSSSAQYSLPPPDIVEAFIKHPPSL